VNRYEQIKQMSLDEMAAFIYGIIDQAELQIFENFSKQYGIGISRVTLAPEIQILVHKQELLKEVK